MPDATWAVPVMVIAKHRAAYYAHEFGGDIEKSLAEDTEPLFERSYEVTDWASNNMDWTDVEPHAVKLKPAIETIDYKREWISAPMKVVDPPTSIVVDEAEKNKAVIDMVATMLRSTIGAAQRQYESPFANRAGVDRLLAQKDLATWVLSEIDKAMGSR